MNTNNKEYVGVKMRKETRARFKKQALEQEITLIEYLDNLSKELADEKK